MGYTLSKGEVDIRLKKIRGRQVTKKVNMEKVKNEEERKESETTFQEKAAILESIPENSNECWTHLKSCIQITAEEIIEYTEGVRIKKPWGVTGKMWEKMEERRIWKNINTEEAIEDEAAVSQDEKGFSILREEAELALREIKNGKATGVDGIPIELVKCLMDKQLEEEQFGFRKAKEEEMILRDMLLELSDNCEQYGMKINANKTNTMVIGRKVKKVNLRILKEAVEQINSFKYLGCTIRSSMSCCQEVKRTMDQHLTGTQREPFLSCGQHATGSPLRQHRIAHDKRQTPSPMDGRYSLSSLGFSEPTSFYRRPPMTTGSLDRPPWNVAKRHWMASAMAPETDLFGGRSFASDRQGSLGGNCRSRNGIWISVGCKDRSLVIKRRELLDSQKFLAQSSCSTNEKATEASFIVSYRMAQAGESHKIAKKLIKPCAIDMVKCMINEKEAKQLSFMPLSNDTVARRSQDMAAYVKEELNRRLRSCQFALEIDESSDVVDLAVVLVFVR
ncbi:hypothetical protein ANN_09808 [Periplaneta americana]|uniref:Uncharacterized protein n=1 Tax=Periplaneta americana TaxID=6978 RepID=A0ABQ8TPY3_PERAM|nr:hypothetical protein ANN_09808 [Periplaneta americana]